MSGGPVWKKPEDVMRQMREKKKALQARFSHSGLPQTQSSSGPGNQSPSLAASPSGPTKRKNPFRRSPVKKIRLQARADGSSPPLADPGGAALFQLLEDTPARDETQNGGPIEPPRSSPELPAVRTEHSASEHCFVDWSLKTRARFTSSTQFACSSTLKTSEEASGITGFVRCASSPRSEAGSSLDTSTNARFHACCLYWQHPWLPWLSTFPRDAPTPVTSSSFTTNVGADPKITAALHNDWCESFRSLFGLLRARQCPFFYVCCHQFTILFRAAGIGGVAETHALMTPTTKGLREVLQSEDIAFSMPLRKSAQPVVESSQEPCPDSVEPKSADHEDDGSSSSDDEWINTIGLHSNLRSKLEAERLQDGGQGTVQGSYSDSMILIEGVETQGLFNWLMTTKLSIPNTGILAGIPPTLLAPVAFHGATLRPLKVRQGLLKQNGQNVYSIEVQGPVLPHSAVTLMHLLAQNSDYTAIFTGLASTKPFSLFSNLTGPSATPAPSSVLFGKQSLSDCGLDPQTLDLFCSARAGSAVSQIQFKNGIFHLEH